MAALRNSEEAKRLVAALLVKHGRTYCDKLQINIASNTPSVLFRGLCATILFSARISVSTASAAAMAVTRRGLTTARKMAASTWEERTHVLNAAGYARYDESTSIKLGDAAEFLVAEYVGDLRRLREKARRDGSEEHRLIQEFTGIGQSARISSVVRYRPHGRSSILLPMPSHAIQPVD